MAVENPGRESSNGNDPSSRTTGPDSRSTPRRCSTNHSLAALLDSANASAQSSRYIFLTAEKPCAITAVGADPSASNWTSSPVLPAH